jgi:hypothetical protein
MLAFFIFLSLSTPCYTLNDSETFSPIIFEPIPLHPTGGVFGNPVTTLFAIGFIIIGAVVILSGIAQLYFKHLKNQQQLQLLYPPFVHSSHIV